MDVLKAMGLGIIIVILFLSIFSGNINQIIILALLLPIVGIITIAFLTIVNISLDKFILAGLAVGIGMIIDSGIILTESLKKRKNFSASLNKVIPPLLSSTLTTLVVLIPLFFLGELILGIKEVKT